VLEEWLGRFGLRWIAKFENVSQRHLVAFVRMPSDFSLAAGFSQVQPIERTTNRFNVLNSTGTVENGLPQLSLSHRAEAGC